MTRGTTGSAAPAGVFHARGGGCWKPMLDVSVKRNEVKVKGKQSGNDWEM